MRFARQQALAFTPAILPVLLMAFVGLAGSAVEWLRSNNVTM